MNCNTTHYRANSSSVPGDPTSVENPHGKLTIKLVPKGKVVVMELLQAMKQDPHTASARFDVDVSTER